MSEEIKQEGEFKIKTPSKPKNLGDNTGEPIKVNMKEPLIDIEPDVKKVVIKKEDTDAVQTQETNDSDAIVEESKDSGNSEEVVEEVRTSDEEVESPLTVIEDTAEEEKEPEATTEVEQAVQEQKVLPENIEKLVSFMEETGGTVEDYVRLNADYTNVDNQTLIREYYKQTKPHLDSEDISLLLEDFNYDEDIDEPKDIRKRKIAFKEEVAKAKSFLEQLKGKYYDEIKLRPGVTQEQKKATEFFNRYNEEQQAIKQKHVDFIDRTKKLLNNDFEGFDFKVSDKKFRYGIKNPTQVAENQSDITNFIKTFLNDKGEITDTKGYHKALYAARNADTIAQHFYEQGKADAVKDVMAKSKNISNEPRQTVSGDVYIGGLKVKAISGADSSKLKIKTKKFN
ncbi:MAG: hypothetical protein GY951_05500 [Psychromonas sp.]|nr:hypothetical protein [Psychromonas sp.]